MNWPYRFLAVIVWFLWVPVVSASTEPSDSVWRCAANGGINTLYVYLRVNGVECSYSDLVKEQRKVVENGTCTASTLRQIAGEYGVSLKPVRLTVDDLFSSAQPVIVSMDGQSPNAGAFLLLLSVNNENLNYLNGPSAAIHKMALSDFRRIWSGIALVPDTHRRTVVSSYVIGFALGLIVVSGFLLILPRKT